MENSRVEIGALYGFRALMALMVANFHFWQQGWLSQSVTLFGARFDFDYITRSGYLFVDGLILLSGFLLFLPHARALWEGAPVPRVKRFYGNRLTRILPSYVFAVLAALFLFALPQGSYRNDGAMALDVLTHLTFTFTFFQETYLFTPLHGVLWTVAVEMQFYLLFPLLAKAARKRLPLTLCLMALAGWAYRYAVIAKATDTAMLFNQLPAFLDVYALGMLGAAAYVAGRRRMEGARWKPFAQWAMPFVFLLCLWVLLELLRAQSRASAGGGEAIRLSQMALRLPFAIALLGCMLSSCFLPKPLEWLFSNRLMRFCAAISFNFYIWHQTLSVQFARYWFPDTLHTTPGLQYAFTLLCYTASLAVAMATTYGLEIPFTNRVRGWYLHRERKSVS